MTSALDFMLAARRSEMQALQALSVTCALVVQVSRLVHALQRERGYSNFCLGGQAATHVQMLDELSQQARDRALSRSGESYEGQHVRHLMEPGSRRDWLDGSRCVA